MKHVSSYQPKATQAFLALSACLTLFIAGCSSSENSSTTSQTSTVTIPAQMTESKQPDYATFLDDLVMTHGYILAQLVPAPMAELPPLPELQPTSSLADLLLPPIVESPIAPDVEPASLESPAPSYIPEDKRSDYSIYTGPNYTDKVVLTFDDCPGTFEQLLSTVEVAQANNIGLVLAPTGNCIESYQNNGHNIIDTMRNHGQYVINHSVSHPALSTLSRSEILAELGTPGVVTNYGRPPYGDGMFASDYSQTVADTYQYANMHVWLWTVDTEDWKGQSASEIVTYVVNNSAAQDTVLMHMNHQAFNAESVVSIKQGLNARGLEVCRAYDGVTPGMLPAELPC